MFKVIGLVIATVVACKLDTWWSLGVWFLAAVFFVEVLDELG